MAWLITGEEGWKVIAVSLLLSSAQLAGCACGGTDRSDAQAEPTETNDSAAPMMGEGSAATTSEDGSSGSTGKDDSSVVTKKDGGTTTTSESDATVRDESDLDATDIDAIPPLEELDADRSFDASPSDASDPVSDCVSIEERPYDSCQTICKEEGRACAAECYSDWIMPSEVAYFLDEEDCQRDEPYGFGVTLACDDAINSSMLAGMVTYVRCCCGADLGDGGGEIETCTPEQAQEMPEDMVCVPEGVFEMGASASFQGPVRQVAMPTYFIDRNHVTVQQYDACVAAGVCTEAMTEDYCNSGIAGREQHPINCIDWFQAEAYCAWRDKRLPTQAEWEKAARGTDARTFPWGEATPVCDLAVMNDGSGAGCGTNSTMPVGSKSPLGDSPYGATDMAGNVWDWTADWYNDSYDPTDLENPQGPSTGIYNTKVLRGGDYISSALPFLRSTYRVQNSQTYWSQYFGFRCSRTPP